MKMKIKQSSLSITLNIHFHFTSYYYLKDNKQIKHMNQTLKQYLHVYCNYPQDNQFELLYFIEVSYSNTLSTITNVSSFFANKSYYTSILIHYDCNIVFFQAYDFATSFNNLQSILKSEISIAQQWYSKSANIQQSFFLYQQFITRNAKVDHSSYFITVYIQIEAL